MVITYQAALIQSAAVFTDITQHYLMDIKSISSISSSTIFTSYSTGVYAAGVDRARGIANVGFLCDGRVKSGPVTCAEGKSRPVSLKQHGFTKSIFIRTGLLNFANHNSAHIRNCQSVSRELS